jgi:hypothetical protein
MFEIGMMMMMMMMLIVMRKNPVIDTTMLEM